MEIKTKFNEGEAVIVIDNNNIIRLPIINTEYISNRIYYTLLKYKANTLLDKDNEIVREECDCFLTMEDLALKYKNI